MTQEANRWTKLSKIFTSALIVVVIAQSAALYWTLNRTAAPEAGYGQPARARALQKDFGPEDPFNGDSWDPFQEMQRMQRRFDRMFEGAFDRFRMSPRFGVLAEEQLYEPRLDVDEEPDRFVVRIDLPGVDGSRINVEVQDSTVRIAGSREETVEQTGPDGHSLRRERRVGHFDRSVALPEPVDEARMQVNREDGVLTIILPKLQTGRGA